MTFHIVSLKVLILKIMMFALLSSNMLVYVCWFFNLERCGGRKEYPLVFIKRKTEIVEFVGNWDRVQKILDAEDNSEEFLRAHPTITTFPRLFNK